MKRLLAGALVLQHGGGISRLQGIIGKKEKSEDASRRK